MRVTALLAGMMICAASPMAFAGSPVGHYEVDGNTMGGGTYSGTVDVTATGDTYHVVWSIGNETFIGTGIGNDSFMAISYASGSNTGIALYAPNGGDWSGVWTYAGGTTISTETWKRE
jgi:hypothetical protein